MDVINLRCLLYTRENAKLGDGRVRLELKEEIQPGDRNVDAKSIHRTFEAMRLGEITRGVNVNIRKCMRLKDTVT